jgi:hypothetical protein
MRGIFQLLSIWLESSAAPVRASVTARPCFTLHTPQPIVVSRSASLESVPFADLPKGRCRLVCGHAEVHRSKGPQSLGIT